jgi:hypothetical protein
MVALDKLLVLGEIPKTKARLQLNVVPAIVLLAIYEKLLPLHIGDVAVLPLNEGVGLTVTTNVKLLPLDVLTKYVTSADAVVLLTSVAFTLVCGVD